MLQQGLKGNEFIISPVAGLGLFYTPPPGKTPPYTCTRKGPLGGQCPSLHSFHLKTVLQNFPGKKRKKAVKMNPFNAKTEQRTFLHSLFERSSNENADSPATSTALEITVVTIITQSRLIALQRNKAPDSQWRIICILWTQSM